MRRTFDDWVALGTLLFGLGWLVLAVVVLSPYAGAQCTITSDANPVAVNSGATHTFTASCGTGLSWTVTGAGSINSSTGVYSAPASVSVFNQARGAQELPLTAPYSLRVDALPVDPHSSMWLTRAAQDHPSFLNTYHNLKFFGTQTVVFYQNTVTNSTPTQLMHCFYGCTGYNGTAFSMPPDPVMESCSWCDATAAYDRHLLTINKDNGDESESYNRYFDFKTVTFSNGNPTQVTWTTDTVWPMPQQYQVFITCGTGRCSGAWATASNGGTGWRVTVTGAHTGTLPFDSTTWGAQPANIQMESDSPASGQICNTCNTQGAQKFNSGSYAQQGGVDASGMPLGALSLKMEEWYAKTLRGDADLGHALRTTMSNAYLSARAIWPATSYAFANAGPQNGIIGGTPGNPTVFTVQSNIANSAPCNNYTYTAGCPFNVVISGNTGGWTGTNGEFTATAIDATHFSIPVNSTGFGAFPGGNQCPSNVNGPCMIINFFPYGAVLRLKSSVNVDGVCTGDTTTFCPFAKTLLRTIQRYGMYVADGTVPSDNWDTSVASSEFHPKVLMDAAAQVRCVTPPGAGCGLQPLENFLEVVSIASSQLSTNPLSWLKTPNNRVTVTVTGSNGTASQDVLLQGTTIGTDRERLTLAANVAYQLNVWVRGNASSALNYAIDMGITGATVSSTGLLTMPTCPTRQNGTVKVTHATDASAVPLYIEVACIPVSSDGAYRLALGNYSGPYTDTTGKVWWAAPANAFNNGYEVPGVQMQQQDGTWPGFGACSGDTAWNSVTDQQLYNRSTQFQDDERMELGVPAGTYTVTLYGEPGFGGFGAGNTCGTGRGTNVFDLSAGPANSPTVAYSLQDGYVLAGNTPYAPYTLSTTVTMASAGLLDVVQRLRAISTYGVSASSLLVAPSGPVGLAFITTSPLPSGVVNTPYNFSFSAQGGTAPYSYSVTAGSFGAGLTLDSTGALTGSPAAPGTFTATVQLCDSVPTCVSSPFSITIASTAPGLRILLPSFTLPAATAGVAYTTSISATGGTVPYTWCVLEQNGQCDNGSGGALPAGLSMVTASNKGVISGVPFNFISGTYRFTVKVTDTLGHIGTQPTAIVVQPAGPPPAGLSVTLTGNFTMTGNGSFSTH